MPSSTELVNQMVAGKQLLGSRRLSVIFADESTDFKKVHNWGVKNGYGRERLENMHGLMRGVRERIESCEGREWEICVCRRRGGDA